MFVVFSKNKRVHYVDRYWFFEPSADRKMNVPPPHYRDAWIKRNIEITSICGASGKLSSISLLISTAKDAKELMELPSNKYMTCQQCQKRLL